MENKGKIVNTWTNYTVNLPWREGLSANALVTYFPSTKGYTCDCEQFKKYLQKDGKDCAHIETVKLRGGEK